jgi:hypothetical protein
MASDMAVVVVSLFGHVDDMEQAVGILVLVVLQFCQLPDGGNLET